jgi:hypothetical protein
LAAGVLAVVLVTRPDLVLPRTAGFSSTAGAAFFAAGFLALGAAAFGFAAAFLAEAAFGFAAAALAAGLAAPTFFSFGAAFLTGAAFGFAAAGFGSFFASLVPPDDPEVNVS